MNASTRIACLTVAGLTLLPPMTYAASSTDLSVRGMITPNACTPALTKGGNIDYGKIPARDLPLERPTPLPLTTLQLSVNCEAPTVFALHAADNRLGSSYYFQPINYGLGLINGDQKLGSYWTYLRNPVGDSPVTPLFSFDKGETWISTPTGTYFEPGAWVGFGDISTGFPYSPKALRSVTVDLQVTGAIAPARGLNLTQEVPLDGSATLDVVYL